MKSVLVIGLGRFGKHLAQKMLELGNDVMVVDKDERIIDQYAPIFTDSFIGDCTNEAVLRSIGVNNFDICFVTIGQDFQASLEVTSLLKELGAQYVVSKAKRDRQAMLLAKIGADDIVYPEREIAEKLAVRYNSQNIYDYIPLTSSHSIYEVPVAPDWIGKTVGELDVRNTYKVSIIAVISNGEFKVMPGALYRFCEDDHMVIIGESTSVFALASKTKSKK